MISEEEDFLSPVVGMSTDESVGGEMEGARAVRLGKRRSSRLALESVEDFPKIKKVAAGSAEEEVRKEEKEKREQNARRKVEEEEEEGKRGRGKRSGGLVVREKEGDAVVGDEEGACFERSVETMQASLGRIMEAVGREEKGKVQFAKGDQAVVREAVYRIQNEMLELLKKQLCLERRIRRAEVGSYEKSVGKKDECDGCLVRGEKGGKIRQSMRREIVTGESESEGDWERRRVRRRRRTYAEASKGGVMNASSSGGEKIEGRVVVTGKKGWKTPPKVAGSGEGALVITSRGEKDARKLAEALAKTVSVKDMGGAPRAVRKIRDGKLVIVAKDGTQKEKIKSSLGKMENVEVRESRPVEPLMVVSGVGAGMGDGEFIGKFVRGFGGRVDVSEKEVVIVKRVKCRNPWKENVVVRVGGGLFREIVKIGKVEMDCALHFVEEYLGLSMCFRCCRFGHIMKFCREEPVCHRCGGGHDGKECSQSFRRCVNCLRMYGKVREHGARDSDCPAMREVLARSRLNINYAR